MHRSNNEFTMEHSIIGFMAAFCTTISFLPQAIKVIKTQKTDSLSLMMYSLFTIGILMWLIYGYLLQDLPMLFANSITLVLASIILFVKVRNKLRKRRGEPMV